MSSNTTVEYLHKVIDKQLLKALNQDISAIQRSHAVIIAQHLASACEMMAIEDQALPPDNT